MTHRCDPFDPCPRCEREAEQRAEERAERRVEWWTVRGEKWQENVVYGERT
jgi:hypothetical protein